MSLKKHLVQLLVVVFGLLILGLNVSAESAYNSKDIRLTENEYDYLVNEVGHTKEEIESLPEDVLKHLIKDKAKLVSRESTNDDIATSYSDGEIKLMKTIPSSQIDVKGYGYKVTSDRSGSDKFYLLGQFRWKTLPTFTLVDKMTIGFPESAGLSIPMSSGKPTQHQSRHCWDYWGDGNVNCSAYKKPPLIGLQVLVLVHHTI
ncbi:hypothetical protein [Ornithinibacillus scapharcae]|uniref:hypothetical protein n=1 Tax=Ornithinibacillus scapharcae TaxID=1147159 RepID=UPI000225BDD7|nr:hypothetical protein [Ornithinibacillus scapharcae]